MLFALSTCEITANAKVGSSHKKAQAENQQDNEDCAYSPFRLVDCDTVPLVIAVIALGFSIGKFGRDSLWEVDLLFYVLGDFWFWFLGEDCQ